jgi:hypothetical protein
VMILGGLGLLTLAFILFCAAGGEGGLAIGIILALLSWLIGAGLYLVVYST